MSDIRATIGLDTRPLQTGLDRAQSAVNRAGIAIKGAFAKMFTLQSVVNFVSGLMTEMDRFQKLSIRFGESAETLQRLNGVARVSGANIEVLVRAMQTAGRAADAANNGSKGAAEAFARLGIDAQKFVTLPLEQKAVELARGMERVPNAGERVNLALEVMGRNGGEVLPMLTMGADNLAQALGAVPVASDKAVNSIAYLNDTIFIFKQELASAVAEIAPFVVGLLDVVKVARAIERQKFELFNPVFAKKAWQDLSKDIREIADERGMRERKLATSAASRAAPTLDPEAIEREVEKVETKKSNEREIENRERRIAALKRELARDEMEEEELLLDLEHERQSLREKIAQTTDNEAERLEAVEQELRVTRDIERVRRSMEEQRKREAERAEREAQRQRETEAANTARRLRALASELERARDEAERGAMSSVFSGRTGLGGISSLAAVGGGGGVGWGSEQARQLNELQKQTAISARLKVLVEEIVRKFPEAA